MSQNYSYQTPHPDKAAEGKVLTDLVCGMDVSKDSPYHTEHWGGQIYFCSEDCLKKFQGHPSVYLTRHETVVQPWKYKDSV